jgi:cobalt/nickel transport system ATP-binding protein
MIELQNVSYSYEGVPALRDVSFSLNGEKAVAFIGPNGSGKSSLLKILCGILTPSRGRYLFDGEEVTQRRLRDQAFAKKFHQRVGLVFQNAEAQLFCASVREEVAFGPMQMGLEQSEVDRRVHDTAGLTGIEALLDRPPWDLSEGEKRRVAFACVLSLNPDVLLLDEPMSGLDPRSKRSIAGLLRALISAGTTVLCATHDFRLIEGIFESAVVFSEDHRVVGRGPYAKIVGDTELLSANNLI